ncbi:MAG: DUF4476 domain-containing protein [Ferruginibacter sp.]
MRFFIYLFFSFLFSLNARAQHNHFIYIQTEDKQAFYVKLNEKIFSSSAAGYVIIPKLLDGQYNLSIGFPKNEWPAQHVDLVVNGRDDGFILRNFDSKVWGLFNLQTMNIQFATDATVVAKPAAVNKTDAFSNTLAEVTNTPSIRQEEPVKEQPPANLIDTVKAIVKEEPIKVDAITAVSTAKISKVFSILDNSGRSVIYAINDVDKNDTVRILIPYDKMENEVVEGKAEVKNVAGINTLPTDSAMRRDSIINREEPGRTTTQESTSERPLITDIKVTDANATNRNEYKITILNPACKVVATIDDLWKLGKKMSAAVNDEDRLSAAKKVFRSKCLTTEQVRNLCSLFSNDEGRYNFLDAAYGHVSNVGDFKGLQSQLSDEYFITRFKAMLR